MLAIEVNKDLRNQSQILPSNIHDHSAYVNVGRLFFVGLFPFNSF